MKEIKDYLHLYLGCRFVLAINGDRSNLSGKMNFGIDALLAATFSSKDSMSPILILRPLSSMTDEEFKSIYKIAVGAAEDLLITDFHRLATNEVYVRFGFGQSIFGFSKYEGDVRVEEGYSFYIKHYLVKNQLEVDEAGMIESEKWFNDAELKTAHNQTTIFRKLLSMNFDLFGLIEAGLAIETTTN